MLRIWKNGLHLKDRTHGLRKEKLPMAIGESFQYRLDIVNGSANTIKGVKAYDVLPETDDKNISNTGGRGSEYTVRLKGPLDDNADFKVIPFLIRLQRKCIQRQWQRS